MEIFTRTINTRYTMDKDSRVTYYDYGYNYGYDYYGGYGKAQGGKKIGDVKASDNNGHGTAKWNTEDITTRDGYMVVKQDCTECHNSEMIWDEYDDAYWCDQCGHYVTGQELYSESLEINDDINDEIITNLKSNNNAQTYNN